MDTRLFISKMIIKQGIPEDNYLSDLPVVKNTIKMGGLVFDKPITFFVGDNGVGKSTLIEAIAIGLGFNPEGGTKNYLFQSKNTHSALYDYITLVKTFNYPKYGYFLRAETLYNSLSYLDYVDDKKTEATSFFDYAQTSGESKHHACSHGESFLSTIANFIGNGIYILDEPEAALSPKGIMTLMCYLDKLVKQGSQFIISTHSPMLITMPDSTIYSIEKDKIERKNYWETEHYSITRRFLEKPKEMLKCLIENTD